MYNYGMIPMGGHSSDLYRHRSRSGAGKLIGLVIVGFLLCVGFVGCNTMIGTGGWGPTNHYTVTVNRMWVDTSSDGNSGSSSHYMVSTDQGVFEVDNGPLLGVWNADELYGTFKEGKRFNITTQGNRVVGWFFQEYPYVTKVEPAGP